MFEDIFPIFKNIRINAKTFPQQFHDILTFSISFNRLNQNSNTALTTGEDSSPPTKKRMLSRSSSKVQTPVSSPTHSPGAQTSTTNFGADANKIKRNNVMSSVEPSVHTMFASNFLSNVSVGYDVLLHTFQYLKVQVNFIRIVYP